MVVELSITKHFQCVMIFNGILSSHLQVATQLHLDPYFASHLTYDLHHTGDHNTCTYQFTSVYMENLIRISFLYPGPVENAADFAQHTSDSCREEENFIHIGNDLEDVGRNSWSSFLFCGDARVPPFVSRAMASVTNLGAVFDKKCRMEEHATRVCRSANYYLHRIRKIRDCLNFSNTKLLVHSLVTSRLDYANGLLHNAYIHPYSHVPKYLPS